MLINRKIKIPDYLNPRPDQINGLDKLTQHDYNTLVCAATGAGKSILMFMLAKHYIEQGKTVLISVHMLSVLKQMIKTAKEWNFDFGVIQGNHALTNHTHPLQIASISTLIRRSNECKYDVLLIDEIHVLAKKLRDILITTKSRVIGFSATPFSLGLSKIFNDNILNLSTAHELTKQGILAPFKVISGSVINVDKLKVRSTGEFTEESIEQESNVILGDTIKLWREYANNQPTLVFASSISHATVISDYFNDNDIGSRVYSSDTFEADRIKYIEEFKSGEIKILCTVAALNTGFDCPEATVMIDLRPLRKSVTTLIQSLGRILRSHPNKKEALLLDCTNNIKRMAHLYSDWFFNGVNQLDGTEKFRLPTDKIRVNEKDNVKEGKGCPKCQSSNWIRRRCMVCGYTIPHEPTKVEHQVKNVEFKEFDVFSAVKNHTNTTLWRQISNYVVSKNYQPFLHQKYTKKALAIYKSITGEFPKYGQSLDITKDGYISPEVAGKIKHQEIKYRKGLLNVR